MSQDLWRGKEFPQPAPGLPLTHSQLCLGPFYQISLDRTQDLWIQTAFWKYSSPGCELSCKGFHEWNAQQLICLLDSIWFEYTCTNCQFKWFFIWIRLIIDTFKIINRQIKFSSWFPHIWGNKGHIQQTCCRIRAKRKGKRANIIIKDIFILYNLPIHADIFT